MGLRTGPKTSPFSGWSGLGYGLYGPVRRSNLAAGGSLTQEGYHIAISLLLPIAMRLGALDFSYVLSPCINHLHLSNPNSMMLVMESI